MTVAFTLFSKFPGNLGNGNIDLAADDIYAMLSNAEPDTANDEDTADITQIANGNGYATGGVQLDNVAWTEIGGGVWKFTADDWEWESASSGMATFRYGILRSAANDKLIGWYDRGAGLTLPVGARYHVNVPANGLFRTSIS